MEEKSIATMACACASASIHISHTYIDKLVPFEMTDTDPRSQALSGLRDSWVFLF